MKKPLVVLTGPTAVGKTKLSISLAKALNGEIISADSMQVYKYMDIGSAKITEKEMDGVPHHLINVLSPLKNFISYASRNWPKRRWKIFIIAVKPLFLWEEPDFIFRQLQKI